MPIARRRGHRLAILLGVATLGAGALALEAGALESGLAEGARSLLPAAHAATAPIFEGQGIIELLRPTDLVGDAASPAELHILALDPDGKPQKFTKLEWEVTGGTATELVDAGGGLYKFTFTPAVVDTPGTATLALKGKLGAKKKAFERSWTVSVMPARSRQLWTVVSPAQLTFGVDKTANVDFKLVGGDPRAVSTVKLALNVSAGAIANVTNLGGGQFNGLFTPAASTSPRVALVTAVDSGDPTQTYGSLAIPLSTKVDQSVTVKPKANVILKVAGREFGPVTADSRGRAKVPIVVPPGVTEVTRVEILPDGTVSEAPLALKVTEFRRIALFPTTASIPSDARLQVPVRAMVVTPAGLPDESAQVVFAVTAGTVGPTRHEGGGIYVATYTPPNGNALVKATLTATLPDRPKLDTETRPMMLVPVRATTLALSSSPLAVDGTTLTVTAKVGGPDGSALPARALSFTADGARLQEIKDLANGEYQALFNTTGKGPVEVSAAVAAPATGNALARVIVMASRERLPADGLSSSMLTVATVDDFGYPVPDQAVDVTILSGDGAVPATATTNADGIARIYYTAGRKFGLVSIEAKVGARNAGVTMMQAPPSLALPDFPVSGSASVKALTDEWAGAMAGLRIERQ